MSRMYRLNHDGTVELCDDTPDETWLGPKYMHSTMRAGRWIKSTYVARSGAVMITGEREYIDESEVPNVIKLAVMIGG